MKIKNWTISILLIAFLGIYACDNTEQNQAIINKSNSSPSKPTAAANKADSSSIGYYILQCKQAEPAQEIPLHLCEKFIQPALADKALHPYLTLDKASYHYGEIAYEDAALVAITFYYKAVNGLNLLAASFVATYNRLDGNFIDSKMVFGSSTFDFQKTKGYNMGLSYKSEMAFVEVDSIIFIVKSDEKITYSAFQKNVPTKANSRTSRTFILNKNGRFLEQ